MAGMGADFDPYQDVEEYHDPPPTQQTNRYSQLPTGIGVEPLNVVILGASYAGLAVLHHFFDSTIDQLCKSSAAPNYRLILISPSTRFYWSMASPLAVASPETLKGNLFIPMDQILHRHRAHNPCFIQGEAVALDPSARKVTVEIASKIAQNRVSVLNKRRSAMLVASGVEPPEGKVQTVPYHALIIATGSSAHSNILSLYGPHLGTMGALSTFHIRLQEARTIVIAGGGCSGVSVAGQLAQRFKPGHGRRIILFTGASTCLPHHPDAKFRAKAERQLYKLKIEIYNNLRILAAKEIDSLTGQTRVELSNGSSMLADLYIPCTGVTPNTTWAPDAMKTKHGAIRTNANMRVNQAAAGDRVYAIGDCASYSSKRLHDVYDAVPVLMRNLTNDLLAYESQIGGSESTPAVNTGALKDEIYLRRKKESMIIPIGRWGGVGTRNGVAIPSIMVQYLKHDFGLKKAVKVAEGKRAII